MPSSRGRSVSVSQLSTDPNPADLQLQTTLSSSEVNRTSPKMLFTYTSARRLSDLPFLDIKTEYIHESTPGDILDGERLRGRAGLALELTTLGRRGAYDLARRGQHGRVPYGQACACLPQRDRRRVPDRRARRRRRPHVRLPRLQGARARPLNRFALAGGDSLYLQVGLQRAGGARRVDATVAVRLARRMRPQLSRRPRASHDQHPQLHCPGPRGPYF